MGALQGPSANDLLTQLNGAIAAQGGALGNGGMPGPTRGRGAVPGVPLPSGEVLPTGAALAGEGEKAVAQSLAGRKAPFDAEIGMAADETGLPPALIRSIIQAESSGDPSAVSPKGAAGLMQLMPGTAEEVGVTDPHDPKQSIGGGSRYFKKMLDKYEGDASKALAAYNWGQGNVDKWLASGADPADLPKETLDYVRKIRGSYEQATLGGPTDDDNWMQGDVGAPAKPRDMLAEAGLEPGPDGRTRVPAPEDEPWYADGNRRVKRLAQNVGALGGSIKGELKAAQDERLAELDGSGTLEGTEGDIAMYEGPKPNWFQALLAKVREGMSGVGPGIDKMFGGTEEANPLTPDADSPTTAQTSPHIGKQATPAGYTDKPQQGALTDGTDMPSGGALGDQGMRAQIMKLLENPSGDPKAIAAGEKSDKNMALLMAGLSMLSNASKPGATALGALGEGGMTGVGAMAASKKSRKADQRAARSENLAKAGVLAGLDAGDQNRAAAESRLATSKVSDIAKGLYLQSKKAYDETAKDAALGLGKEPAPWDDAKEMQRAMKQARVATGQGGPQEAETPRFADAPRTPEGKVDAGQLKVGQIYTTPKGPMKFVGGGKMEPVQTRQGRGGVTEAMIDGKWIQVD